MKKTHLLLIGVLVSAATLGSQASAEARKAVEAHFPVSFIENQGQIDPRVDYYILGKDKSLYFNSKGVTYSLLEDAHQGRRWNVKLDFVGADPEVKPVGADVASAKINYFKGPRSEWKTGIQTFASIKYPDLWKGIDLVYRGERDKVEYRFLVQPGADPRRIRLSYSGAKKVFLNSKGALEIKTPAGGFVDGSLRVYQEKDGKQVDVAANYVVEKRRGASVVGFRLGDYDRALPLVIDPTVIVYAGFIGAAGYDRGHGIAVDGNGNAYVAGVTTDGTGFPATAGSFDDTFNEGNSDAYVAKVAPDGLTLVYATFIGGSLPDLGRDVAVDADGNAYLTGDTQSNETSDGFPVTVGPDLTFNDISGSEDVFVAKISPDGSALVYCGYIGGIQTDLGYAIAVDADGSAYVTGQTTEDGSFPATVGPDTVCDGLFQCAFVAKVKADGTGLVYAGYIGEDNVGYDVAVDTDGNAYVTGLAGPTFSPASVGPDTSFNGVADGFVAKVKANGSGFDYAGFIGGSAVDYGYGIAVDGSGSAYVAGVTASTELTFPVTGGAFDTTANGGKDGFVAKVKADGSGFDYVTFLGGSADDSGDGIAVDGSGNAYIAGGTHSTESDLNPFPLLDGPDLTANGSADGFVTKLSFDGASVIYSGFIGGSGFDVGVIGDSGVDVHPIAIAIDGSGNAYVAGDVSSTAPSFPATAGPDLTSNGLIDTFVAKIGSGSAPACGDGVVNPGEECDDGNTTDGDGCKGNCTNEMVPTCGDGILQAGEQCDDGNTDDTDACRNDCTVPAGATGGATAGTGTAGGATTGGTSGSGDSGGCSLIR